MGYNTNITICNDNLEDYLRRPEQFVQVIADNARTGAAEHWGVTVLPADHADATQLIAAGGNFATKVYTGHFAGSHHKEDGQVEILRQWAHALGYQIVPNSAPA